MPSKLRINKEPSLAKMLRQTAPRTHNPSMTHEVPKRKLVEKAMRKADREDY